MSKSETMAALIGNIGPFDESVEQWSSYTERFEYFVCKLMASKQM
mgnify:CR=1 FL=1